MAPEPYIYGIPPPAPPQTSTAAPPYTPYSQPNHRGTGGRGRGRGGDRGGYRGRGRGGDRGTSNRGGARGGAHSQNQGYGQRGNARGGSSFEGRDGGIAQQSQYNNAPYNNSPLSTFSNTYNASKQISTPKPDPAPSVPAFGASNPITFPSPNPATALRPSTAESVESSPHAKNPRKRKRKHNQLGLTPHGADYSSSGGDTDEEARLATGKPSTTATATTALQFEYKGTTAVLRTPAEIASWIAERRAKWPTAAKVEAHKAEEAKRKAVRDAARQEAFEARRKVQEERRKKAEEKRGKWEKGGKEAGEGRAREKGEARGKREAKDGRNKKEKHDSELARLKAELEEERAKVLALRKAAAGGGGAATKQAKTGAEGGEDSSELSESSSDVSSSSSDADSDSDPGDELNKLAIQDADGALLTEPRPEAIPSQRKDHPTDTDQLQSCNTGDNPDDEDDEDGEDAAPEEITRADAKPVRMPASRDNHLAGAKSKTPGQSAKPRQPVCHLWTHVGRCPLKDKTCSGAHPFKARGSMEQSMTLRERLVERELEREAERVLAAIRGLGDEGFFEAEVKQDVGDVVMAKTGDE